LFNIKQNSKSNTEQEILLRAIHSNGAIVKELLAMYGHPPEAGAKIYTEIMNIPENEGREVYHKMDDDQKTEILVINGKKFI